MWWCLDGKASEYYDLLIERNQDMAYMDLIRKLEKRFGFRELPETAQEEETHILPGYRVVGTGLGTPTDENPKPLADMEEGKSMKGREVKGEGGRVLVCDVLKV